MEVCRFGLGLVNEDLHVLLQQFEGLVDHVAQCRVRDADELALREIDGNLLEDAVVPIHSLNPHAACRATHNLVRNLESVGTMENEMEWFGGPQSSREGTEGEHSREPLRRAASRHASCQRGRPACSPCRRASTAT